MFAGAAADSNVKDVEVKGAGNHAPSKTDALRRSMWQLSRIFENMPLQQFVARAAKCCRWTIAETWRRPLPRCVRQMAVSVKWKPNTSMGLSVTALSAAELMFDAA